MFLFCFFLRSSAGPDKSPDQRAALRRLGRVQAPQEEDASHKGRPLPTPSRTRRRSRSPKSKKIFFKRIADLLLLLYYCLLSFTYFLSPFSCHCCKYNLSNCFIFPFFLSPVFFHQLKGTLCPAPWSTPLTPKNYIPNKVNNNSIIQSFKFLISLITIQSFSRLKS